MTHGSQTVVGRRYVVMDLRGLLLETGQTVVYHVEGDGDLEHGQDKAYTTDTPGTSVAVDVPHYAGPQIAFAATTPGTITDVANGLATVLTGDTITIRGSALNDGVYAVSTGGVAGTIRTTEATVLEAAGPYVSITKRALQTHNMVFDRNTGLTWSQLTTKALKWGDASDGKLAWYDAADDCTLHPAGNDLTMVTPNILRIVGGAGELATYHAGDAIVCTVFAAAANLLPGYRVLSVAVNGADLDIVLDPANNTLVAEALANGVINLTCKSAFAFAAAACESNVGGHDDWRVPNINELGSLLEFSIATARVTPDPAAFPGWPYVGVGGSVWVSTTDPTTVANSYLSGALDGGFVSTVKTAMHNIPIVRGG